MRQNAKYARRLRGRESTGNTIRCDATRSSIIARTRAVSSSRTIRLFFFFSSFSFSPDSRLEHARVFKSRCVYGAACPAFRSFITRREQWRDHYEIWGKAIWESRFPSREANRGEPDLEAPLGRSIRVSQFIYLM